MRGVVKGPLWVDNVDISCISISRLVGQGKSAVEHIVSPDQWTTGMNYSVLLHDNHILGVVEGVSRR